MKKTTAKIIQISDIIQWNEKNEIELSPKYQRNSVWNEKAKAYLIDTIIRGLPIPPIFLRQKTDITTKSTTREIIDGQQRIRAILEFIVNESFSIKKAHNKMYGGKKYSELDEDAQEAMLEYEILAEVVTEKDESCIYDMFARSRDYRDSIDATSSGLINKTYVLYIDIVDEAGGIATIATILAMEGISIKNIGISHNREHGEGALRISFYDKDSMEAAWARLKKYNYTLFA